MLSIPVWGVEIKNEVTEPLLAPCLLKYAETGITPQEQRGRGTPKKEAIKTDEIDFFPKYFCTISTVRNIDRTPEIKHPKIRYGENSCTIIQIFDTKFILNYLISNYFYSYNIIKFTTIL